MLPLSNSFTFLLESTINAELAVFVPCTWSSISVKYLPPITRLLPSAGLPTKSLEPAPPCAPAPPV